MLINWPRRCVFQVYLYPPKKPVTFTHSTTPYEENGRCEEIGFWLLSLGPVCFMALYDAYWSAALFFWTLLFLAGVDLALFVNMWLHLG